MKTSDAITADNKKNRILDIEGTTTGLPVTKQMLGGIIASIVVYLIIMFAVDLSAYGPKTTQGLALFVSIIVLMIFSGLDVLLSGLIMIFLGTAMGFWTWPEVSAYLGSSPFYSMLGMTIVALGAEYTPFGQRMAFWFLKIFGQKPVSLVVVFGFVTAVLSSFVSNTATIILMSSIGATLLASMNEKPGESALGRTLMLLVTMGSMLGGCALISGSPFGNTIMIGILESATSGEFTVTYAQWAFFGAASFLVTVFPICMIYVKCSGLKNDGHNLQPRQYYEDKLRELGPIGGSEIRWIILVVAMVALMISGKNTAEMAMLFAMFALLPVVGVSPYKEFTKRLPINILLSVGLIPMMSNLLTTTGVIDWLADILLPVLSGISSPLVFSIACALVMGLGVNIVCNAMSAFSAALLTILAPITVMLGFNPVVVLIPTMFSASFFWAMSPQAMCMMNRGYGYWEDKDLMIPGFISVVFASVAIPLVCFAICGAIGMSPLL